MACSLVNRHGGVELDAHCRYAVRNDSVFLLIELNAALEESFAVHLDLGQRDCFTKQATHADELTADIVDNFAISNLHRKGRPSTHHWGQIADGVEPNSVILGLGYNSIQSPFGKRPRYAVGLAVVLNIASKCMCTGRWPHFAEHFGWQRNAVCGTELLS